jgi:hypothetical protein
MATKEFEEKIEKQLKEIENGVEQPETVIDAMPEDSPQTDGDFNEPEEVNKDIWLTVSIERSNNAIYVTSAMNTPQNNCIVRSIVFDNGKVVGISTNCVQGSVRTIEHSDGSMINVIKMGG